MTEKVPPDKFILDATAGFRMMWFNKHHPNCIYLDRRPECEPDIVGDFRDLKQFPDETFKLIVFDPPHSVHNIDGSHLQRDYGWLKPETWQSDLQRGFKECWRVLKFYGILIFKWGETDKSFKEVISLFPIKPLFLQKSAGSISRKSKPCSTFWFCFMKIPDVSISKKAEQK